MKRQSRLQQQIARRDASAVLEALYDISQTMVSIDVTANFYDTIHQALSKIYPENDLFLAMTAETSLRPSVSLNTENALNTAEDQMLGREVTTKRKPVFFDTKDIDTLLREYQPEGEPSSYKVWLGVPLTVKGSVKGVLGLRSKEAVSDYLPEDLSLLTLVSRHVVLAIERQEQEYDHAEQQQILKRILESSPVGIALVQNRVFKWVNKELVEMLGYPDKTWLENKSVRMVYSSEEEYEKAGRTIYNGLITKGTVEYDIRLLKKDTTLLPVHIRLSSNDETDPMAWTIATFEKIGQQKATQKIRTEKQKLQGALEMAEAVCHETDQPLQKIQHYLDRFQEDGTLPREELNDLKKQALNIGLITKRLSNITRYETVLVPDDQNETRMIDIWHSTHDGSQV